METQRDILDSLLVLRCREGDSAAFEQLIERWQRRLLAHCRRLSDDPDAASDIVQETWVAVINGLHRLDSPEAFPKWVYRIATNKTNDWLRRRCRRRSSQRVLDDEARHKAGKPAPEPGQFETLHAALAALGGDQRALLNLHYVEGFGIGEIAEILAIPAGTVKSRLHHARAQLREAMKGDYDGRSPK